MKKTLLLFAASFISGFLFSQDPVANPNINTASRMLQEEKKLTLGGYAQIDYNQPLSSGTYNNGVMDVHRLVLMVGYKFNERTKFITEIEFEHVKEVLLSRLSFNMK